jgi:CBS domain-containing protein
MSTLNASFSEQFFSRKLDELHYHGIITMAATDTIQAAASLMAKEKISILFIKGEDENLLGYITDITLRDKVLAKGVPSNTSVAVVMEHAIVSVSQHEFLYEALLLMFQTKTRYLLVKSKDSYIGWISRTKILMEQSNSPFIFIQSVRQALDTVELKHKWGQVPEVVHRLIQQGLKASIINQIITSIADTITLRVIENSINKIGPPPAKFVFFVLGSEGRGEQTLKTDQDNAIIYEDKANEHREEVRAYFLAFAEQVSTDLDSIGIDFCKGGLMAKNPKWTHSLSHWKRNYESWIQESSEDTIMKYATFFDCRAIYGDFNLLDELKAYTAQQLQHASERFWVHMGENALKYEPPLTIFKGIKTVKIDGEKKINSKETMNPIVDLVRVFALKNGIEATNTGKRIELLQKAGVFTNKEAQELDHAYYYLMALRLEKQTVQLRKKGSIVDNFISTQDLTKVQMVTLIEIFKVIKSFQLKVRISFTNTIF